jgi:hypothetical protein
MGLSGCLYEAPKYSSDKPLLNDPQPILSKSAKGYWLGGMPNLINSTSRLNFNSEIIQAKLKKGLMGTTNAMKDYDVYERVSEEFEDMFLLDFYSPEHRNYIT